MRVTQAVTKEHFCPGVQTSKWARATHFRFRNKWLNVTFTICADSVRLPRHHEHVRDKNAKRELCAIEQIFSLYKYLRNVIVLKYLHIAIKILMELPEHTVI